jgi:putative tryptophan/tyrosine transport system substrate-binding protein
MQFVQLRRRELIRLLGGAAVTWPLAAHAEQDVRIARVGVLGPSLDSVPAVKTAYPFFSAELRKLGFEQGRNLLVEYRSFDQGVSQATAAVNEMFAWKADVLFVIGVDFALRVAAAVQPPIPVVMAAINFDPIAKGFVKSLVRPGGNVTGVDTRWTEITAKQVEVLQEAFPDRNRLGVLWDAVSADQFSTAEREAKARGLAVRGFKLENSPYDFATAFRMLIRDDAQIVLVASSPLFSRHSVKIAALAIEHRLPTMFILKYYVEDGGLMSYGVDFAWVMRRGASFVAKILRGAKPADLPVEQAERFEFTINLKTAKAIGVTLPTATLLRADEVFE